MATDKERADNPSQDPNHPMNKTVARDPKAPRADTIDGPVYSSENLMTEQEETLRLTSPASVPRCRRKLSRRLSKPSRNRASDRARRIRPATRRPCKEVTRSQGINKGKDDRSVPKPDKPLAKEHK